jgi:hypothetical protein
VTYKKFSLYFEICESAIVMDHSDDSFIRRVSSESFGEAIVSEHDLSDLSDERLFNSHQNSRSRVSLVLFLVCVDLLSPFCLTVSSIATTSVIGLVFQAMLIVRFVLVNRFTGIPKFSSISLWLSLILEVIVLITSMAAFANPVVSEGAKIAGTALQSPA